MESIPPHGCSSDFYTLVWLIANLLGRIRAVHCGIRSDLPPKLVRDAAGDPNGLFAIPKRDHSTRKHRLSK
jgi:hypothetical protein